ncbi:hypothetical protein BMS3Bbin16_00671 [archaeon BMS3Bbin16]|nr:hypothetical protein BMS3Bbin16_00671 [archaeon BMS3Bbin16]
MQETNEDCSWQQVYKLNGIVLNADEDFDNVELDELDEIAIGFTSPLKSLVKFDVPEIVLSR